MDEKCTKMLYQQKKSSYAFKKIVSATNLQHRKLCITFNGKGKLFIQYAHDEIDSIYDDAKRLLNY